MLSLDQSVPRGDARARRFTRALQALCARDPALARMVEEYGRPVLWRRQPGFAALVLIVLEQQVSITSAKAVFERLCAHISPFTADRVLAVSNARLRQLGLTRQKAAYCKALASAVEEGRVALGSLASMSDTQVRAALTAVKGIGTWSADIYLLLALDRDDVWPTGDRALVLAIKDLKGLAAAPSAATMETAGAAWRPWRSIATRLLWHYYLSRRGRVAP